MFQIGKPGSLNNIKNLLVMLFFLILLVVQLSAQVINSEIEQAELYFKNQDWQNAVKMYEKILTENPEMGKAWFNLGFSYYSLNEYDKAIDAYKKANDLEYNLPGTRYNLACAYALLDDKNMALSWLTQSIAAGFRQIQLLHSDPDLKNLRQDARFQELAIQLDENVHPCLYDPKYREFDFWVGEWDVYNPQGQKVGSNSIRKMQKNCVLLENWKSVRGSGGMSINYYDPAAKKWKQNWVDEFGDIIWYEGDIVNQAMHFTGEHIDKDGNREIARVVLELLPDGRVHHLIEHSKDEGKSWYTWFEGYYQRKQAEDQKSE